jgi:hypothetical protein
LVRGTRGNDWVNLSLNHIQSPISFLRGVTYA